MNTLVTICARGGSKGIPGKNIRRLNNIPLIAYTIQVAQEFAKLNKAEIAISTDDLHIKNTAEEYGVFTEYVRPERLATDYAGKIDTIEDLLLYQESKTNKSFDYVLDLDVTSPLRTLDDLIKAFETLKADSNALNLFSVNNAARNPYFNMVEQKEDGYYDLVKRRGTILTRQSAPKVYDLNASFYFYRKEFFNEGLRTVFTERSLIYLMPHLCFDLDHPVDFEFLEFLIANNKLDFSIWKY
jgi:CMP-N-acetylneuraminic acid synthetase